MIRNNKKLLDTFVGFREVVDLGDSFELALGLLCCRFMMSNKSWQDFVLLNEEKEATFSILEKFLKSDLRQRNRYKNENLDFLIPSFKTLIQLKNKDMDVKTLFDFVNKFNGDKKRMVAVSYSLLENFAEAVGRKYTSFLTPNFVANLMTKIACLDQREKISISFYDFSMRSGQNILIMQNEIGKNVNLDFFGQEADNRNFRFSKMLTIMGVDTIHNVHLHRGDALGGDWPVNEEGNPRKFDVIVSDIPYSAHWIITAETKLDARYREVQALPPKSKADYAYILHGIYHLKDHGTMVLRLPHGVLFRGGAEAKIRQFLLRENLIDMVIGLPGNLDYSTSIPTILLVIKKSKKKHGILFIDGTSFFTKEISRDKSVSDAVNQIIQICENHQMISGLSRRVCYQEICNNNYNLNIARYVNSYEEQKRIPLAEIEKRISDIDVELAHLETSYQKVLKEIYMDINL
ncbi:MULTISPECIES: N-6 DNA methylase [Lacticaseibacillus]|uniref:N-6 DNA methylase n=1 Tax=Lacticaseibacillus TaxID=2759736 RepID=UPI00063DC23B|nr:MULTISPECIES: N-6 DNA methylase [Lacticaseibacillus]KLI76893.1 hypothetical protein AAW28_02425 [Lacticaseibacillus casei]